MPCCRFRWSHLAATIPVESTFVRIQTGLSTDIADSARTIFAESGKYPIFLGWEECPDNARVGVPKCLCGERFAGLSGFYSGWRTYFVLALKVRTAEIEPARMEDRNTLWGAVNQSPTPQLAAIATFGLGGVRAVRLTKTETRPTFNREGVMD